MDLEAELARALTTEIARELITEKFGSIDNVLFEQVVNRITGDGGSGNAFDAPILYAMLAMMKGQV